MSRLFFSVRKQQPAPSRGWQEGAGFFIVLYDSLLAVDRKELVRVPINIAVDADCVAAARDRQAAEVAALRVRVGVFDDARLEYVAVGRNKSVAHIRFFS